MIFFSNIVFQIRYTFLFDFVPLLLFAKCAHFRNFMEII